MGPGGGDRRAARHLWSRGVLLSRNNSKSAPITGALFCGSNPTWYTQVFPIVSYWKQVFDLQFVRFLQ